MMHDAMDTLGVGSGERCSTSQSISLEQSSPVSPGTEPAPGTLSVNALATQCLLEIGTYCREDPSVAVYSVELLRRATVCGDQDAWACLQQCLSRLVRGWLRCHPSREAAYLLDSEENYVAQTFERFWLATARTQKIEFSTLAAALRYLRTSLNSVLLDTLRAYSRPREVSLPESGELGESLLEDTTTGAEVWEVLQNMLPSAGEQRLAYLLFHCGLKPREIVRCCPQEFADVREIYRLRRNIMERLLRNANQLRWRLTAVGERQRSYLP